MNKEERIIKLHRGIASEQTPDYIRERMQAELDELLKPEPETPPIVQTPKPVAKKPVKPKPAPKKEVKVEAPPVPQGPSAEDKARLKAEYEARLAKKKEKQNQ